MLRLKPRMTREGTSERGELREGIMLVVVKILFRRILFFPVWSRWSPRCSRRVRL